MPVEGQDQPSSSAEDGGPSQAPGDRLCFMESQRGLGSCCSLAAPKAMLKDKEVLSEVLPTSQGVTALHQSLCNTKLPFKFALNQDTHGEGAAFLPCGHLTEGGQPGQGFGDQRKRGKVTTDVRGVQFCNNNSLSSSSSFIRFRSPSTNTRPGAALEQLWSREGKLPPQS